MPSGRHRMVDMLALEESIAYLLWRTQSELAHAWLRCGEHELIRHAGTFDMLLLLGSHPGVSQAELARALLMDKSNVAAVLRGMQQREWVSRRLSPDDARRYGLFLTPQGVHQLAVMRRAWQRHEQALTQAMGDEFAGELARLLKRAIGAAQTITSVGTSQPVELNSA